jgi:hypothetical protein
MNDVSICINAETSIIICIYVNIVIVYLSNMNIMHLEGLSLHLASERETLNLEMATLKNIVEKCKIEREEMCSQVMISGLIYLSCL